MLVLSTGADSLDHRVWAAEIAVSCFRLRIGLRLSSADALDEAVACLPVCWHPLDAPEVDCVFSLVVPDARARLGAQQDYQLFLGASCLLRTPDRAAAFAALAHWIQMAVAEFTPDFLFVHAGVVGWQGQVILAPGYSFSGKSTLVAALLQAGASYYSDEFAVLDEQGLVHPFPRRLQLRGAPGMPRTFHDSAAFGAVSGIQPLPVGLVLCTRYAAGARFRPRPVAPGRAVLELLAHTVAARRCPERAFRILQRVASSAQVIKGARGEASETARGALRSLSRLASAGA
jgi:hypothetical protein